MASRSIVRGGRKTSQVDIDRSVFVLDETTFRRFVKSLRRPLKSRAIQRLLGSRAPWEQHELTRNRG